MPATDPTHKGAAHRRRMRARSPHEPHRTATPLELLFDLVFVVAIAEAAQGLHHEIANNHIGDGLLGYAMVFFAIWWAWMNFTWFASAYDNDDLPYRLAVFVQIAGALILAGGVPAMFTTHQLNLATVGGYVVMRFAAVAQWLRAAKSDPERRTTARRYALGISLLQIAWVALLFAPSLVLPVFVVLVALELALPVWAERAAPTTWHPHHIAERYGLLTLIVLGETILAATMAVQSAVAMGETFSSLAPLVVGGLLIVYSMWWYYFDRPVHDLLTSLRKAVVWGYGHYFVFAAAAAVGAGLTVAVDYAVHHKDVGTVTAVAGPAAAGHGADAGAAGADAGLGAVGAGAAVAIPVATYVLWLWFLHDRPEYRQTRAYGPIAAALILLTPFSGHAVLLTGVILASMLTVKLFVLRAAPREAS